MPSQMQGLAAWLLTYALHSTFLLGLAWAILRFRRVGPVASDVIWKVALVGGIVTATAQGALSHQPAGSFALDRSAQVAGTDGSTLRDPLTPVASSEAAAEHGVIDPGAQQEDGAVVFPGSTASTFTLPSLPNLIAWSWLVVAVALVAGYAARRLVLLGRLGDRRLVGDERVTDLLDTLRVETGVNSPIRLTTSRSISSPVALGGEICLPAAVLDELDPEQQRAMLAHELAHLVRRDPQWLAAACVLERAFFFQPLNRLARRGIQSSAEYLADEWAARRAGGVPLARALVKVAEWIQASPLGVPVAGFAEERSQLTVRVSRLLDRTTWATQRSRWGVGVLAAAMLVVTTAFAPGVSRTLVGTVAQEPMLVAAEEEAARDDKESPVPAARQQDTSVVAAVIERLRDENDDVRRAAADALGRLQHPSAIQPLIRALEDEDPDVRNAALNALGNYERGVPPAPIRKLLASSDSEVRQQAAHMLGHMKDRSSIPALTALIGDPKAEVRQQALSALDDLDAPIEEATIGRALEDQSEEVRQTALNLAGERRMATLVPTIIKLLEDPSGDVRESAAESLTEMRTDASHRALRMAITHRDPRVRRVALDYLGDDDK